MRPTDAESQSRVRARAAVRKRFVRIVKKIFDRSFGYTLRTSAMKPLALLSVSDKTGIVDFAKALIGHGFEILSTGNTARHLQENQLDVMGISYYTGMPEILDGRVKTLHPKVHGGLLAKPDDLKHKQE